MNRSLRFACFTALFAVVAALPVYGQSTYTWTGASNGAWYLTTNWAGGPANTYPGTSTAPGAGNAGDIALFNNASNMVGIDLGAASPLTLGAINFQSGTGLTIGNSSLTTAGILQLNGATVNSVANTLVSVGNFGADLTLAPSAAGGTFAMTLQLGNTNGVFNIFGDANARRALTISTVISEAVASGFTLQGGGNLILSNANTFTGNITVTNGRLQVQNATALGTGAGKTIVQSGGTVLFQNALTYDENVDFAGVGYTEAIAPAGALRISNVAVTLNGALTMTGNATLFVDGNTTIANGVIGETGGARALEKGGPGTLNATAANSYTGATTIALGGINLSGANGSLATSSVAVSNGANLTLTNATGANNGNRLPDAAPVTLNNGTLNFFHNNTDAVNFSESVGAVTVAGFLNTIPASQALAGQTSTLTIASLTRSGTGAVNFTGTGLGVDATNRILLTTVPVADTGGLIGPWAFYNVSNTTADFASYSGANGVVAMTANTDTTGATWGTTSNLKFTTGTITVPATGQVNSLTLAQTAATTVNLNAFTGRIGSGGVLITGAFGSTISGGNLTAGQANDTAAELVLNVFTNTATVSANIVNNGTGAVSLTKIGGGTLILSGTNTFSGPVVVAGVNNNSLQINNATALGNTTSVTIKQAPGGGNGAQFSLSGGISAGTGVTLTLESLQTGGIIGSATAPVGLNGRTGFQSLAGQNTWNGIVALAGNNFVNFISSADTNRLTIAGPIVADPVQGFTGNILTRGNGTFFFNGAINLPTGGLASTDGNTIVTINPPTTGTSNLGFLNPYAGRIQLGGNNALNASVVVSLGQNGSGNLGQFWLNGFNQTVAGLQIAPGGAAGQIVQNGGNTASTLTFAGNATPSVFAGIVRDNDGAIGTAPLSIAITQGRLTLAGVNTFTGGVTVSGGTLLTNNATGSGTGTGTVALSGTAILGGTGTVAGPITVATGATIAPGASPGILTAGANVTFSSGSNFAVELNGTTAGTGHDRLVLSGTASTLTLGNATLSGTVGYTAAAGDRLFIIVLNDAGSTISGTFNGIAQDGLVNLGGTFTALVSYTGDSGSSSLTGGNDVVVYNFTPVPEPATILALSMFGLGAARCIRRRRIG